MNHRPQFSMMLIVIHRNSISNLLLSAPCRDGPGRMISQFLGNTRSSITPIQTTHNQPVNHQAVRNQYRKNRKVFPHWAPPETSV
ncbi:hypothetical protein M8J75_015333 [Diaphorina citri]|nr:hypothetical protein M8J75_015333 [Diaphorina citri]